MMARWDDIWREDAHLARDDGNLSVGDRVHYTNGCAYTVTRIVKSKTRRGVERVLMQFDNGLGTGDTYEMPIGRMGETMQRVPLWYAPYRKVEG